MSRYTVLVFIFENQGKQSCYTPFPGIKRVMASRKLFPGYYMIQTFYGVDFLVDFIIRKNKLHEDNEIGLINEHAHSPSPLSPYSYYQ